MKRLTLLIIGALSVMAFAVVPSIASAAPPADKTIVAVTHTQQHPDTTNVSGTNTIPSDGGPIWAYDNLALRFVVTPQGGTLYKVAIEAQGSFDAIANPVTGGPYVGSGSVKGVLYETLTSVAGPDKANLLPQQDPATSQGTMLLQLFPDATNVASQGYSYSYQRINAPNLVVDSNDMLIDGVYTQTG